MLVDIQIDPKTFDAQLKFEISNFKDSTSYKNAIATITMIAGDYSLDPELEIEDVENMVKMALKDDKSLVIFYIGEDGIEAELVK